MECQSTTNHSGRKVLYLTHWVENREPLWGSSVGGWSDWGFCWREPTSSLVTKTQPKCKLRKRTSQVEKSLLYTELPTQAGQFHTSGCRTTHSRGIWGYQCICSNLRMEKWRRTRGLEDSTWSIPQVGKYLQSGTNYKTTGAYQIWP